MNYALGYFVFYYPMHDAHSRPVRNVLHVLLAVFVNSPDINKCDRNLILDCWRGSIQDSNQIMHTLQLHILLLLLQY